MKKGKKKIVVEKNNILGIGTQSFLLSNSTNYYYDQKKKANLLQPAFLLDSIKSLSVHEGTIEIFARVVSHFRDSVSGENYSTRKVQTLFDKGYFKVYRVFTDTLFSFQTAEIKNLTLQYRKYRRGADGLGVLGASLIGTIATVSGIVYLLEGNNDGFIFLGFGSFLFLQVRHWIKRSQWFKRYEISNKKWTIKYS